MVDLDNECDGLPPGRASRHEVDSAMAASIQTSPVGRRNKRRCLGPAAIVSPSKVHEIADRRFGRVDLFHFGLLPGEALNARAVYLPGLRRFEYFDTIKWLPQSYDAASTWSSFWMYSVWHFLLVVARLVVGQDVP
jgi:hypothetical protein